MTVSGEVDASETGLSCNACLHNMVDWGLLCTNEPDKLRQGQLVICVSLTGFFEFLLLLLLLLSTDPLKTRFHLTICIQFAFSIQINYLQAGVGRTDGYPIFWQFPSKRISLMYFDLLSFRCKDVFLVVVVTDKLLCG